MHDLRGDLLQKDISSIDEYKESCLKIGCSIMSYGWTDAKNRTIISLFLALKEASFLD